MTWMVLNNSREIQFYEKLGGEIKKDWSIMKLTEPNLGNIASREL